MDQETKREIILEHYQHPKNKGLIDELEIYNMNPRNTDLKYEVLAEMLEAAKSFSIIGYYILFMIITWLFFNYINYNINFIVKYKLLYYFRR